MRILVVDDELVSQTKLMEILAAYGTCDSATSGEEALQKVSEAHKAQTPYNLITMDVEMTGIKGHEAVRRIRENDEWRKNGGPRILMVTACADVEVVVASIKAGCDGYLIKPFSAPKVQETLKKIGIKPKASL